MKTAHLETIYHHVEVLTPGCPELCIVLQQKEKVFCQLLCFCFYGRQREPQDPDQALQSTCDHLETKPNKTSQHMKRPHSVTQHRGGVLSSRSHAEGMTGSAQPSGRTVPKAGGFPVPHCRRTYCCRMTHKLPYHILNLYG